MALYRFEAPLTSLYGLKTDIDFIMSYLEQKTRRLLGIFQLPRNLIFKRSIVFFNRLSSTNKLQPFMDT